MAAYPDNSWLEGGAPERMGIGLGSRLGRYRIDSILGRGGMGTVFLATDLSLGRSVAVKVLAPELADDPEFRERFMREARLLAAIDHPSVVTIHEAGEADGLLFLAMRYVAGRDLGALLRLEAPLGADRALRLLEQVARALDTAHQVGLVHRDVKASNILVSLDPGGEEHAVLADFGLTRSIHTTVGPTRPGQLVGSVGALAPEQIAGGVVDGRADQYALACLLYECLAGSPPFEAESDLAVLHRHLHDPPPNVSLVRPDLPAALGAVVARGLAKAPGDRYPSCSDLISAAMAALGVAEQAIDDPVARSATVGAIEGPGGSRDPAVAHASPASPRVRSTLPIKRTVSVLALGLLGFAVVLFVWSTSGARLPGQGSGTTASMTPGVGRIDGVGSSATPGRLMARLLSRIPTEIRGTCVDNGGRDGRISVGGSKAGVTCPVDAELVGEVSYWLIENESARDNWWATELASRGFEPDMGGCWDGRAGETDHERGRLACWAVNEMPRLRWTDDQDGIYGLVKGEWITTRPESGLRTFRRIADWWGESAVRGGTRPVFDANESSLLGLVDPDVAPTCVPYPYVGNDGYVFGEYFPVGDIASILCAAAEPAAPDSSYYLFSDAATLDTWFDERVSASGVELGRQGCWNGEPGVASWERGRLACFMGSGLQPVAHLRWTDRTSRVYGSLVGRDLAIPELYAWWKDHRSAVDQRGAAPVVTPVGSPPATSTPVSAQPGATRASPAP